ncbi:MAG: hypothetical protein ACM34H_04620, partial [Deltaproteobacteria bacterium]
MVKDVGVLGENQKLVAGSYVLPQYSNTPFFYYPILVYRIPILNWSSSASLIACLRFVGSC